MESEEEEETAAAGESFQAPDKWAQGKEGWRANLGYGYWDKGWCLCSCMCVCMCMPVCLLRRQILEHICSLQERSYCRGNVHVRKEKEKRWTIYQCIADSWLYKWLRAQTLEPDWWAWILAPSFTSCVTLSTLPNLSVPYILTHIMKIIVMPSLRVAIRIKWINISKMLRIVPGSVLNKTKSMSSTEYRLLGTTY